MEFWGKGRRWDEVEPRRLKVNMLQHALLLKLGCFHAHCVPYMLPLLDVYISI